MRKFVSNLTALLKLREWEEQGLAKIISSPSEKPGKWISRPGTLEVREKPS